MRVLLALFWASMAVAQTLTLTGPSLVRPGQTITVAVNLAAPAANTAALQWDIVLPPGATATATAGPASTTAAKTLYCRQDVTRCLLVGINANVYAAGVVAIYQIQLPATQKPGELSIVLSGLVAATLEGDAAPLTAGPAYAASIPNPDLNGDGRIDVLDMQIIVPFILGPIAQCPHSQDLQLGCDLFDAQLVARAVVGG